MTQHNTGMTGWAYDELHRILLAEYGIDLHEYERDVLSRRIEAYCRANALSSLAECVALITRDGAARRQLGDLVYSHTTHFNRTPEHFEYLVDVARQWRDTSADGEFVVWSVGCSTGQEPYTIAIALMAHVFGDAGGDAGGARFRVIGSDCSPAALEVARAGCYRADDVRRLSPIAYHAYFVAAGEGELSVAPAVRRHVAFSYVNLVTSDYGPDGVFDAVFLRNVLEFHVAASITAILVRVRAALKDGGHVILDERRPMSASDQRAGGYVATAPGCYRAVRRAFGSA